MKTLHRIAFLAWLAVVIALTLLKSFYQIGYLWDPDNQRVREIILEPLDVWRSSSNWFLSVFEYGGNTALFIPFGALLFIVFATGSSRCWPRQLGPRCTRSGQVFHLLWPRFLPCWWGLASGSGIRKRSWTNCTYGGGPCSEYKRRPSSHTQVINVW